MATFKRLVPLLTLALLSHLAQAAPANGTSTASAPSTSPTVPYASNESNSPTYSVEDAEKDMTVPQPVIGSLGAKYITNENVPLDRQNPDLLAPPTTDHGDVKNAKWPFSLSHNRIQTGGWARQQNVDDFPISTSFASVNFRLEAGAIRELHWHTSAEWAYVLKGTTQITAINAEGQNYIANVRAGDLWYFPSGVPHSLQATADDPDGTEFLLVFNNGTFSEDDTFLLTDWLAHVPKEVIAKNFQAPISAFDHIPEHELYIFPSNPPSDDQQDPTSPQGTVPEPFTYAFSQVEPTKYSGGTAKIADSRSFNISTGIAVAEVTVEPGAMRELHWHPTADEWSYFIEGYARITLFAAEGTARTFDYQAGDIGFVPAAYGHYVENTGNTTLKYLELANTQVYQDISLNQWLALTPPALVKAHLGLSDDTIKQLSTTKPFVVGPGLKPGQPNGV